MNTTGKCSIFMNGAQVDLLFGMPAVEYIFKKAEEGSMILDDDGNTVGNSSIAFLVFAGYHNHCIANGLTPKKKIGDFFDWIEDVVDNSQDQQTLIDVAETFKESKSTRKHNDRIIKQVDEIKKKVEEMSGKKSNPSALENSDLPETNTAD